MFAVRLVSESEELGACSQSSPGAYPGVCVELETESLAVCALLQAAQVLHAEGTSVATSFGAQPQALIQDAIALSGQ